MRTKGLQHQTHQTMSLCSASRSAFLVAALSLNAMCVAQVDQFPQVYYNGQGTGGTNLQIRPSTSTGSTPITSLSVTSRIGAVARASSTDAILKEWVQVCLPRNSSTNNSPYYGYMACGQYYMRIHESASTTNHAVVTTASTPLSVRTTAGGSAWVQVDGGNAYFANGSIVARTGVTQVVSSVTWYQVHLPNNCSQSTGWLSGQFLTIPTLQNFRVVGGTVQNQSSVFVSNATVTLSGNGTTLSSEGFYQYKLATNASTTITCTASGYTASTPTSYNHTASGHNYTRNFVMSNAPSCTYALSPSNNLTVPAAGGSYTVNVTTQAGCTWTATESLSWVSITAGASGTGSGTVNYTVTNNTGSSRSGSMTIGGQTFNITQNGACTYSFSPVNNLTVPQGGGSYSVGVTTQAGCAWTASESLSWVTITSGSSGTGSGTVGYTVTSNTGAARNGTITIAGSSFQVSQAGVCTIALNPTNNLNVPVNGGSYSIAVATQAGCSWTASESLSWVSITSGISGTGSGTVSYTVSGNPGTARAGTLSIAGQSFDVSQAGEGPTTYALQVFTNSGGAYNLGDTLLRTSYSYAPATAPVLICADGSRATKVVVTASGGTVEMTNIKFRLTGTTSDVDYYGTFDTTYFTNTSTARSYLKHPKYLDDETPPIFRSHNLEAYNEDDGTVLVTMPVRICRSPVLFVHGLWGAQSSFLDMDEDVRNKAGENNIATYRVDYSETNARSFASNAYVLPMGLRGVTMKARKAGFSAAKIDVVCHSMGGVLARLHLQSSAYKFNIRTLTTINTPHSGTQAANMLFSPSGIITASITQIVGELAIEGMSVDQGAVMDLRINSSSMDSELGGNARRVPALNYSSSSTFMTQEQDWLPLKVSFWSNSFWMPYVGINDPLELAERLYTPDEFDPIVPYSSQTAGMISTSQFEVVHQRAQKTNVISTNWINRLGDPLSSFNLNGYEQADLDLPWWLFISSPFSWFMPSQDSVNIESPSGGASVLAGSSVTVEVAASSESIRYRRCSLSRNGEELVGRDTVDAPLAFDYVIPPDVVGDVRVLAVGIGSDGTIHYDSLLIHVTTAAQLDSIGFTYDEIWLPSGRAQRLFVNGYYNDGMARDVSTLQGVGYASMNSDIAGVVGPNTISTLQPGVTFVVATLNGFSDTLRLDVYEEENIHEAAFSVSNPTICGSGQVTFTDLSLGSPLSRSWQFDGGTPASSTDVAPEVYYSAAGNYDVTLITTWFDKVDTLFIPGHIVVSALPLVTIEVDDGDVLYQGDTTHLSALGSLGVEHYFWSTLDTNQTIAVNMSGDYQVIAINSVGCTADAVQSVTVNPLLKVSAKALLDGPYVLALQMMHDSLRTLGLIPATEPYTGLGYAHVGGGGETVTPAALEIAGSNAIVDWVVLELRSGSDPAQVLQTRCGLIQRDGDIVGKDGVSPLGFSLPEGSYYVAIRHRNHLGAMTSGAVFLSSTATVVDFTSVSTATYGTAARKTNGNLMTLWSGNTLWDNVLKYTGPSNDRDPVLVRIGGVVPTNTIAGYYSDDVNLDGVVKYTGSGNDRDAILVNIGGTVPTQVRTEQLP